VLREAERTTRTEGAVLGQTHSKGSVAKAAALGGVAAGLLLAGATPAAASLHTVGPVAVNGLHTLYARGNESEMHPGLEYWDDFRIWESTPLADTVCNYQAYMAEIDPNGSTYIFSQYSNRHTGCSFLVGFFDFPNWEANYREDTRFRCKWSSDATPGGQFTHIGDLRD
jgi:hypothetical protein